MKKHGMFGTPEYSAWVAMKQRCLNPRCENWPRYGGRGIKVCARWMTFENFFADIGKRPAGHSLERIDCNGNYEPGNCKWIPFERQAANRRTNRKITFNGKTQTISDWARELGVCKAALLYQINANSAEYALTHAFRKLPRYQPLPPEVIPRLGNETDASIAKELGISVQVVGYRRRALGITSYHDKIKALLA